MLQTSYGLFYLDFVDAYGNDYSRRVENYI